jgi:hypothetical protein
MKNIIHTVLFSRTQRMTIQNLCSFRAAMEDELPLLWNANTSCWITQRFSNFSVPTGSAIISEQQKESVHINHQATQCNFGVQQRVGRTLIVTDGKPAAFYYKMWCWLLNRHYLTSRMVFYTRWLWNPSTSLPEPQTSQKKGLLISSQ